MTDLQYATIIMSILLLTLCVLVVINIIINIIQMRWRRNTSSKPIAPMPPRYVPHAPQAGKHVAVHNQGGPIL